MHKLFLFSTNRQPGYALRGAVHRLNAICNSFPANTQGKFFSQKFMMKIND